MSISIEHLENIDDSANLTPNDRAVVKILVAAINDWPHPVLQLIDFENSIQEVLGNDLTQVKMEKYMSGIDYSIKAWEGESLSQLIDVYKYYDAEKSLKDILKELREKLSDH
jgi:hypothetical protein